MPQSPWLFFFGIQQKTVWAKAVRSRGKAVILGIGNAFEGDFSVLCLVLEALAEESVAVRYLEEALARVELAGGALSRFFFLWSEPLRTEGFSLSISARKAVWRALRAVKVILVEHGICPADVLKRIKNREGGLSVDDLRNTAHA